MFASIPVAADTVVHIRNTFMLILNFGLAMFMTSIAGVGIVIVIRVAQLAALVGTAMVQREGVGKTGWLPGVGAVTLRALSAEMVPWAV
jgi:hypothetical protein